MFTETIQTLTTENESLKSKNEVIKQEKNYAENKLQKLEQEMKENELQWIVRHTFY